MVEETDTSTWKPVLFYSLDQTLWLYYRLSLCPGNWTAGRLFSTDNGINWSDVEYLPAGISGPVRAKPYIMKDGTIVSVSSFESFRNWSAYIQSSIDNGITWTK